MKMKIKKIVFSVLSIFLSLVLFGETLAADKNGEIWYQKLGGSLIKINNGQTHTYPNQVVKRTGDNLTMTCFNSCSNNVYTEFVGIVTVIAKCERREHDEIINIDLKLNGVEGAGKVICDKEPPVCKAGITPAQWTCPEVKASIKTCNDPKSKVQGYASGCDLSSYNPSTSNPKIFHVTGQKLTDGKACDNAGNCSVCEESPPAQIDCKSPICSGILKIKHQGLQLEVENIQINQNTPTEFRANQGELNLLFNIKDQESNGTWGKSGMNWKNSKIKIKRISSLQHNLNQEEFSLENVSAKNLSNYEFNINQFKFSGEKYPIFSQKGVYEISFSDIQDNAGNKSNCLKTFYIKILPSFFDKNTTEKTLDSNCTKDDLYANNSDKCFVKFTTFDAFENILKKNSLLGLDPENQNTEGSYDVLKEKGENYLNGIRLRGALSIYKDNKSFQRVKWKVQKSGKQELEIKSLIPSVRVISDDSGETAIMATIIKPLKLNIRTPKVDKRGIISPDYENSIFEVPSRFKPWVFLRISDKPNDQQPTDPWEVVPEKTFCLYAYASTSNKRGETNTKKLPTRFQAFLNGHTDENVTFLTSGNNENLKNKILNYSDINDWKAEKGGSEAKLGQKICTALHPVSGNAHLTSSFTSKIKLKIPDTISFKKDGIIKTVIKPRTIEFPGGNLGLMAGQTCIIPEMCPTCEDGDPSCSPVDPCGVWPELCTPIIPPLCDATNSCPCSATNTCPWEEEPKCKDLSPQECFCQVVSPESCVVTTYLTAGFDVEGGFLADNNEFLYISSDSVKEDSAIHVGNNNAKDVREEITQNAFKLLRGRAPYDNTGNILNLNNVNLNFTDSQKEFNNFENLKDQGITYIKGGLVKIEQSLLQGGTHTIIIEDGNLLIDGDMDYSQNAGTLGVIMLNNQSKPNPTVGNIFINNQVKEFVGIYFADGSITSTLKHGDIGDEPNFSETFDRETINSTHVNNQLILTGTLLTRNTLGGSQLDISTGPWGSLNYSDSVKYDLHYIRRYSPDYDNLTGELKNKDNCTDLNHTVPKSCYPNKHSFIVRIDENVKRVTPPGFSSSEKTNFKSQ